MKACVSCNKEVTGQYSEFKCPSCGEAKIVRCASCKKVSMQYTCPECGFEGP